MSGFPKQKRPHNIRVLRNWIREYADQQQMAESRVRRAVSFMLVALPLEHSLDDEGNRSSLRSTPHPDPTDSLA